jgi:hypothetical protein
VSWQAVAAQRIVAGLPATLRWQPVDGDGLPIDPGAVTVDVASVDGTQLATGLTASGTALQERTCALTAVQNPVVDQLVVTWNSANVGDVVTTVDAVGGVYVSVADVRTLETSLADPSKFSNSAIVRARCDVEQMIERVCRRSFVPTLRHARIYNSGRQELLLDRPDLIEIRSVAPTGPDLDSVAADSAGIAVASTAWPCAYLDVAWVHGVTAVPRDIRRAAVRMIRHLLAGATGGNGMPENAITWAAPNGMGTTTLAVPGLREWTTAIPWVDEILEANTWAPSSVR